MMKCQIKLLNTFSKPPLYTRLNAHALVQTTVQQSVCNSMKDAHVHLAITGHSNLCEALSKQSCSSWATGVLRPTAGNKEQNWLCCNSRTRPPTCK